MDKPRPAPKYKSKIKVLDSGALQGICSCGWIQAGSVVQSSGLAEAMYLVQKEVQRHKHIPKAKKVKKNVQAP